MTKTLVSTGDDDEGLRLAAFAVRAPLRVAPSALGALRLKLHAALSQLLAEHR